MKILIKTKFDERLDTYTTLVHHEGEADLPDETAMWAIENGYAETLEPKSKSKKTDTSDNAGED